MKKTRILFTGDSITDVYRTDVVRAMEGWLDPALTVQERQASTNSVLGMGYPLLAPPSSAPRNPAAMNSSTGASPATGWWTWTPASRWTASTCAPT